MKGLALVSKKVIRSCRQVLEELYRKSKRKYIEIFFHEKDVEIDKLNVDISPLLKTGIVRKVGGRIRANVQVFPLSGKFICTDFLFSIHRVRNGRFVRRRDDVWAILPYESPYIAKKAIVERGDVVLDLATGSGIIALFCAEKAERVVATDINPKAIKYAKFNAILNNLEEKIEFKIGDLFEPVRGMKFDLIIFNGPTIAVPNAPEKYPLYCFGGPDGLQFTKRFIKEAPYYLTKKGKMQWLEPSIGTIEEPESLKIIRKEWKDKKFKVIYVKRAGPDDLFKVIRYIDKRLWYEPIDPKIKRPLWIKPLTKEEYINWISFLRRNGYTHIYSGMYKVYSDRKFKIIKIDERKKLFKRMNYLSLNEYHFLSYSRILQLLKICESY
jgi:release factor glutamine methyltransferase